MDKRRILLVDDEEMFTRSLKSYLEAKGGYEVRAENRGTAALEAVRAFQPDLILLDVIMPDREGGEVAQDIKADPAGQHVPIVFLTAVVSREEVNTHEGRIGGHRFLSKPVSARDVATCIDEMLHPKGGE